MRRFPFRIINDMALRLDRERPGREASSSDGVVVARIDAARNEVRAAASRAGRPLLSKLKSWFAAEKPQKTAELAD